MSSTIIPVPSGDLSSTTSTSSRGSWARRVRISRAMFSRSSYVGTITRARSDTSGPRAQKTSDDPEQTERNRQNRNEFASLISSVLEAQLDASRARRQLHADE